MIKKGWWHLLSAFSLIISTHIGAKTLEISSPDNQTVVTISDAQGAIRYAVNFQGKPVLLASRLGLVFANMPGFEEALVIRHVERSTSNTIWEQPWGERQFVSDHHNELLLKFASKDDKAFPINIRFRVFDDGIGYRFEGALGKDKEVAITKELTEFVLQNPDETDAWWIPSRGWNRYEYPYNYTKLNKIDRAHTPITLRQNDGVHISIHEAALVDFAAMTLDQRRDGTLRADLTPRSDGLKVKTHGDFVSPWRTVQLSNQATGLLNSNLILNLNEPNKLGDVSWVEPGKYIGIWWGMHLGVNSWGSGETHGATTERTKDYMDFAAKYGFDGVLVEGWNIGWDGSWFHNGDVFSFTETYPDFDINAVSEYGKKLGVKLIGHHETSGSVSNYEKQMDAAYTLYVKYNVAQIKTGYVADGGDIKRIDEQGLVRHEWHDSQFMVNHYLKSVTEAAKYKISINTHEPIKDTGLRRTYPNWLSREGARGQEFNAWGSPPNTPGHTVDLVYTRMLSGPMDFTPGIFNLAFKGLDAENRVQTTLAKQLALYVVLYSPIQMAADLIEHYEQNLPAFQFIQDVPVDWQESVAIAGEVSEYVVFARKERNASDWYLGAITNENKRSLDIELSFLDEGVEYQAQIYKDGVKADWKTNPYDLDILSKKVKSTDKLILNLATSGGTAIRFKAIK